MNSQIEAQALVERQLVGSPTPSKIVKAKTPAPINEFPMHGLMGDIVEAIHPHTESSKEAILFSAIPSISCILGRERYALTSGAKQAPNEFTVLTGLTGSGRKGSALPHLTSLISMVEDPLWMKTNIKSGVSSGEGLITPIQDIEYDEDGEQLEGSVGSDDKRLLIVETEWGAVFQMMMRLGNTLSSMVRKAWDDGNLATMTRNPRTVTDGHYNFLCHITPDEIRTYLNSLTAANGFANRYLYAYSHRDKFQDEGGGLPSWGDIPARLSKVLEFSKTTRELKRTPEAKQAWKEIYPTISETIPGFVGALSGRAEAHAIRLQVLYATLDMSDYIDVPHIKASIEILRYSSDTTKWLFQDQTGNKEAEKILDGIKDRGFMTKTMIHTEIFRNNSTAQKIETALELLLDMKLIEETKVQTDDRTLSGYQLPSS